MAISFHVSFVILLLFSGFVRGSKFTPCKDGFFYETSEERCKKCSECPTNQIIRTPCANISDVECEQFSFKHFQSSNSEKDELSAFAYYNYNDVDGGLTLSNEDDDSTAEKANGRSNHGPATVEKGDREYWKKLALALIGALSVLFVVATVIVIVVWAKIHKASIAKLPEDGDMDDADSGYVVIRSIRHMAFPRSNTPGSRLPDIIADNDDALPPLLQSQSAEEFSKSMSSSFHQQQHPVSSNLNYLSKTYKPQRRLLNYDADDVFESDDSACCASNPNVKPALFLPRARTEFRR